MAPRRFRVARSPAIVRTHSSNNNLAEDDDEEPEEPPPKPMVSLRPGGIIFIIFLTMSSFAGHFYPVIWSSSYWNFALQLLSHRYQMLPDGSGDMRSEFVLELSRQRRKLPVDEGAEDVAGGRAVVEGNGHHLAESERREERQGDGGKWQSVFVRDVDIRMWDEPACQGVIPMEFHNQKETERQPITALSDLEQPNQRVLVFLARHGLGNSLRGYVSAYVYALLSGRRLVRLHAAEHAKVYDLLCESFHCGFDAIRWANQTGQQPMDIYRDFDLMKPLYFIEVYRTNAAIAESLKSEYPIMASRSGSHFDLFWHRQASLRECVYAAFRCSSLWCVHSRAMYALTGRGGPTPELDGVIREVLRRHEPPPSSGDLPASLTRPALASIPISKAAVFDVTLHVRTRTIAVEKAVRADTERYAEAECQDDPNGLGGDDEGGSGKEASPKFLRKCLWDCIHVILETLRENLRTSASGHTPGITMLLATDDAALRPEFVRRLQRHGTVFYSTGTVMHTSKAGGTLRERLPTMAEFFLMAKSHTIIEAGSYISTFAYFAGLVGNGTLAAIKMKHGGCRLHLEHKAVLD